MRRSAGCREVPDRNAGFVKSIGCEVVREAGKYLIEMLVFGNLSGAERVHRGVDAGKYLIEMLVM